MSYRATVGLWMLMVCVVMICLVLSPKAHAVQARPSTDFRDVQMPQDRAYRIPVAYLPPAGYAARAVEDASQDDERLANWMLCIGIVLSACGYLFWLLTHPWRFQEPHCAAAAAAGREAVNKCAMPRTKI